MPDAAPPDDADPSDRDPLTHNSARYLRADFTRAHTQYGTYASGQVPRNTPWRAPLSVVVVEVEVEVDRVGGSHPRLFVARSISETYSASASFSERAASVDIQRTSSCSSGHRFSKGPE